MATRVLADETSALSCRIHFETGGVGDVPALGKSKTLVDPGAVDRSPAGIWIEDRMLGQSTGTFQGGYERDTVPDAAAYWTSFPIRLMKRRRGARFRLVRDRAALAESPQSLSLL